MGVRDGLASLGRAVSAYLEGGATEADVLEAVFRLNQEVGRAASAGGQPALRQLQARVNDVTLAVKRRDGTAATLAVAAAMKVAEEAGV